MGRIRHAIAISFWLGLSLAAPEARSAAPEPERAARPAPAAAADWLPRIERALAAKEYEASASGPGLQAPNRKHGLRSWFEPTGVRIQDRSAADGRDLLALRLKGVGRGAALAPVAAGEVASEGARVEIRRPGLVEWYVNSEAGLEQGFTLDERPAGNGPLVLELSAELATASLAGDRVVFATAAGRRLAYGALVARDATGAGLPARLAVTAADRLRIVVDDASATYPLVIDPILTGAANTQLESNQASAYLGESVASAGDVNGDGYADVIVGTEYYDAGEVDEGAAFVFLGSATGIASAGPGAPGVARLESDQAQAFFGYTVAGAGDVNGDGYDDVIVGAYAYTAGEANEGAAFVFLGSATGIASATPATPGVARLESNQANAVFAAVAGAGDVNRDGYADVIVGAGAYDAGETDEGAAFLFLGSASGIANGNPSAAAARIESDQAAAVLGVDVASAGDVNGDGYGDVIVGAWFYDAGETDEGAAFVFLGSASGIANGHVASANARLESDQAGAFFGGSVAGAGDVNGDGYADVIVGAQAYSSGQLYEGAAFVFLGSASGIASANPATLGVARLESDQADADFGVGVASAGDVNGDGYADVIVGADLYDSGQLDEGAAFVFLGGASGIASANPATPGVARLESDQSEALFGYGVAAAGDVNGDGYSDVIVGAWYYDAGQTDEGAAFVYLGGARGIVDGDAASAVRLEGNQANAQLGESVASAGDVNGDGYGDVIVGAPTYDNGEADEGAAFIFHGSASGIAAGSADSAVTLLQSNQGGAQLGVSAASAGDVNGDGYADVIVGAPYYDAGQTDEGAAFVFLGSASGIASGNPATAAAQLEPNQAGAQFGTGVAGAGDVNGDGYADVIVGAYNYDNGQTDEGAAFVFLGGPSGIASGNPTTAAAQLESNQVEAYLGLQVAGAGDVNGDGYADVIVGALNYSAGESFEGAAFVFLGSASGIASGNPATAATQLESNHAAARFGYSVAGAGDVNGDRYADVIVGAYGYDAGQLNEKGAAFVFLGGPSGIASGNPATAAAQLESNQLIGRFGHSVAGAGDVNGDGYADVIVGAYLYDAGQTDEGAAFVFLGSASGIASGNPGTAAAQLESNQVSADFGFGVAAAGDVNGDGFADVIVGAHAYDSGESDEGAAFVFYGNGNRTGRPVLARQTRGGGNPTPVQPWGASYDVDDFQLRAIATHPLGRGRVKLQIQTCPAGVAFGHASCTTSISSVWSDVTASSGGLAFLQSVTGLVDDTLYRWRARVLYAPFTVTQSGITAPPKPAHGPWRRLFGQAVEADLRIRLDTDGDGISNGSDTDDDGDGLLDTVETDTGTYVSPTNTGTDPLDADSDDDGLLDGPEVALGTNPNDPDHDDDTVLDGADNCPFRQNLGQANSDALPAGDVCQCGDVNGDNVVTATDATRAGEVLVGHTLGGAFVAARCNVIGASDGGATDCDVADIEVIKRFAAGKPVTVQNACQAYRSP